MFLLTFSESSKQYIVKTLCPHCLDSQAVPYRFVFLGGGDSYCFSYLVLYRNLTAFFTTVSIEVQTSRSVPIRINPTYYEFYSLPFDQSHHKQQQHEVHLGPDAERSWIPSTGLAGNQYYLFSLKRTQSMKSNIMWTWFYGILRSGMGQESQASSRHNAVILKRKWLFFQLGHFLQHSNPLLLTWSAQTLTNLSVCWHQCSLKISEPPPNSKIKGKHLATAATNWREMTAALAKFWKICKAENDSEKLLSHKENIGDDSCRRTQERKSSVLVCWNVKWSIPSRMRLCAHQGHLLPKSLVLSPAQLNGWLHHSHPCVIRAEGKLGLFSDLYVQLSWLKRES